MSGRRALAGLFAIGYGTASYACGDAADPAKPEPAASLPAPTASEAISAKLPLAPASADSARVVAVGAKTSLACGLNFGCALLDDQVHCWGKNDFGQLGRGTDGDAFLKPAAVPRLSAESIAAGEKHICALSGGEVFCWGLAAWGEVGDGSKTIQDGEILRATVRSPRAVSGLPSRATTIGAGLRHSCAALESGQLFCWGSNSSRQLGTDGGDRSVPGLVPGVEGAVELAGGAEHTCARMPGGAVSCWGEGEKGVREPPTLVPGLCASQITAGSGFSCAIDCGGGAVCWGQSPGRSADGSRALEPVPGGPGSFLEIRAGYFHVCARNTEGETVCWGSNDSGQLGRANREAVALVDSEPKPVRGLSSGTTALCASGALSRNDGKHQPAAASWLSLGASCARTPTAVSCWGEPRPSAPAQHLRLQP